MSNIFELATRQALRFPSARGTLTVEQLWDVPLQSKSGFSLDDIAKTINRDLRASQEESFVAPVTSANTTASLMLDVVKRVIEVKVAEAAASATAAARREERAKLLGLLADKQDDALKALTPEQIQARLAELA